VTAPDVLAVHLPMVQAVVARQAGNSFMVKGWALTLATAVNAYALELGRPGAALVGLLPLLVLAAADLYYLRQERLFRDLYEAVRTGAGQSQPYAMDTLPHATDRSAYASVLRSPSIWPFWSTLVLAAGVVTGAA
jgi:hypothetical protein